MPVSYPNSKTILDTPLSSAWHDAVKIAAPNIFTGAKLNVADYLENISEDHDVFNFIVYQSYNTKDKVYYNLLY